MYTETRAKYTRACFCHVFVRCIMEQQNKDTLFYFACRTFVLLEWLTHFSFFLELGLNCTAHAKLLAEFHFCPETSKRTTKPSNLDLFQITSFPSVLGKFANSDGDMADRQRLRPSEKTLCELVYIFGAAMLPSLLSVSFNVD